MCGFAGFHSPRDFICDADTVVRKMGDRLWRRGPDAAGEWSAKPLGVALAFRRLAIVDLSVQGHQPMISRDRRVVMVMNGEIYNYQELRAQLQESGHAFRGSSDTEALL